MTEPKKQAPINEVFGNNLIMSLHKAGVNFEFNKRGDLKPWCTKNGIPPSVMSKCVRGNVPRWDYLTKFSKIFDVSIDWLLTGKEHTKIQPINQSKLLTDEALTRYKFLKNIIESVREAMDKEYPDKLLYENIKRDMERALSSSTYDLEKKGDGITAGSKS